MIESGEMQFLSFVVLEGICKEVEEYYANKKEVLEWVSTPCCLTRLMKIRRELFLMVSRGQATRKNLEAYVGKYSWIANYEIIDPLLSMEDVLRSVEHISGVGLELNKENLQKYNLFIKTIKDSKWKKKVEIAHEFAYLKEMRDDYRREFYFCLRPFFTEVAKRLKISFEQTNYLLADELEMALLGGVSAYKKFVKERQKKFSMRVNSGRLKIFNYDISGEFLQTFGAVKKALSGYVASAGHAVGRAKIIYHRGEFSKFKKGDVLVTAMTHPEFMQIMKLASAIITDEGGITCHAAIISRELGIPCVIGTKIATQVFKDGDMIKVDAEHGVVRKIS
jgi:phosphohistidine swiveling domain-containing protein